VEREGNRWCGKVRNELFGRGRARDLPRLMYGFLTALQDMKSIQDEQFNNLYGSWQ